MHLHEVDVVLLVYSVVEFASCSELIFWSKLGQGVNCRVIVVANKIDDRFSYQKREDETIAGKSLAEKRGYEFVALSALTGENLEELVELIVSGKKCTPCRGEEQAERVQSGRERDVLDWAEQAVRVTEGQVQVQVCNILRVFVSVTICLSL